MSKITNAQRKAIYGEGAEEREEKEHEYELTPNDSHKSFYRKAMVRIMGDEKTLRSYDTDVASIEDGKASVRGTYSATTLRHIKAFLIQNGFKAESKEQIEKDYMQENPGTRY